MTFRKIDNGVEIHYFQSLLGFIAQRHPYTLTLVITTFNPFWDLSALPPTLESIVTIFVLSIPFGIYQDYTSSTRCYLWLILSIPFGIYPERESPRDRALMLFFQSLLGFISIDTCKDYISYLKLSIPFGIYPMSGQALMALYAAFNPFWDLS